VDAVTGVGERERDGTGGAAGPDDHGVRSREVDVVVVERAPNARGVGVVAAGRGGGEVDGVDRTDACREGVRFDEREDVLFERDGDVETVDTEGGGALDSRLDSVRVGFEGGVRRVHVEFPVGRFVHRWRQRVPDGVADQPEDLHRHREAVVRGGAKGCVSGAGIAVATRTDRSIPQDHRYQSAAILYRTISEIVAISRIRPLQRFKRAKSGRTSTTCVLLRGRVVAVDTHYA